MKLTRLPCWQCSLARFLIDNQNRPFAYGSFDCGLFVSDAILAMTGADLAAPFRGKYTSRAELLPLIRQYAGARSLRALAERITSDYQMPEVPILRAQRGDLVLLKRARDYSLGLVDLNGRDIVVAFAHELRRLPIARASRAWRVG